jgi:hypothetical protein
MPASWPGTGSPPTMGWSAHSARSPGLRIRPLSRRRAFDTGPQVDGTLASRKFRRSVLFVSRTGEIVILAPPEVVRVPVGCRIVAARGQSEGGARAERESRLTCGGQCANQRAGPITIEAVRMLMAISLVLCVRPSRDHFGLPHIGSVPEFPQTSKEIERPAGFPNWDSKLMNRSSAPCGLEVSPASVGSE